MLPDVVDDFRLANPYSKGHEAIFYSFYVFFTKFAAGISLGVSTLCLEWVYITCYFTHSYDALRLHLACHDSSQNALSRDWIHFVKGDEFAYFAVLQCEVDAHFL